MDAVRVIDVLVALEAARVEVSVEGGWGVDALLGRQTRDHSDLDLAVSADACEKAAGALEPLGFRHDPAEQPGLPARFVLKDEGGRQVDFHPLLFDASGNGWQQLADGSWYLHAAEFLWREGSIAGRPSARLRGRLRRARLPRPTSGIYFKLSSRVTGR
jgi:lincosamide nucleotidyltransferase A/C/D/E